MPATLKPPVITQPVVVAVPTPAVTPPTPQRKKCQADFEKDGSLTVQFSVSAEMAQRFVRQACGRDLATYLWDGRGLRHFEHQPLT